MAVMILVGDMGKARENEDDRKVKTQEGRARDSWADSSFLIRMFPMFLIMVIKLKVMNRQAAECWPKAK